MEIDLGLFEILFILDASSIGSIYPSEYSLSLTVVSYLFAVAGSYVGLLISEHVRSARHPAERVAWLSAGAVAMGAGVWSMHFVGMVAYQMPLDVHYSVFLTSLSVIPSVGASYLALHTLRKSRVRWPKLAIASLFMGGGIGAMHYMGMAAMHADAGMGYDPWLFALSIGVAVLFASVALTAKARLRHWYPSLSDGLVSPISAAIMGVAISGMHYTAMSAVRFFEGSNRHANHMGDVDISFMLILINAMVFLLIFLVFAAILARKAYANTALLSSIERQKRLEGRLEKNLNLFRITVENFPGGICLIDKDLIVTLANQGYYDALMLDRASFPEGSKLEDLIRLIAERGDYGDGDVEHHVQERLIEARCIERRKYERTRSIDGRTIEFTRAPLPDGGFVQSVIDVTDMRNAEEERVGLERELSQAQKMESLGTLASGIAHEINTPIQYVGDNIRFLEESFVDLFELIAAYKSTVEACAGDEEKELLRQKEGVADLDFILEELPQSMTQSLEGLSQVARIVNAVKEFSHPGQDEMQAVDLNKTIKTTITVTRNQWKYVAKVKTDLSSDLPLVNCYQGDINQVILNVVVNAAHAIEAAGREESGEIAVSTRRAGEFVEISIADNGTGMPDDVRKRMFDPFFTTKEVGRGTGQGLAITYAIIHQKHGGSIECESTVGKGTCFTIRLPISLPHHSEAAA